MYNFEALNEQDRQDMLSSIGVKSIDELFDIIPDSALSAIDQRLIKADAQIKALADMSNTIAANKADNLKYNPSSSELQLVSDGKTIGDAVKIVSCDEVHDGVDSDGMTVVLF